MEFIIITGSLIIVGVGLLCAVYDVGYEEGYNRALTSKMEPLMDEEDWNEVHTDS